LILILWGKTKSKIPSPLIALSVVTIAVFIANGYFDFQIATIASTFSYEIDNVVGQGIPPVALEFTLPWGYLSMQEVNLDLFYKLLPHSVAIAILGALESLLCAVISDGMTAHRTNPNKELIGQGLANLAVPFFGGIPATAAIARSVANIKSGGTSKLSSVVHSLFILCAIVLFAPYLSYLPMASLSALLLIVAWNMSELKHFKNILQVAPKHDVYVLLTCFSLTVLLDMQIAVGVGMGLAAILFIKRTIDLYSIELLNTNQMQIQHPHLPNNMAIYDINGPMFFGAAQSALRTLIATKEDINTVIINMQNVPMIDMTGLVAFKSIVDTFKANKKKLVICGLKPRIVKKFKKMGIEFDDEHLVLQSDIKTLVTV
jgi:SulP family sulfate permease